MGTTITLKNVKHSEFASHETFCFEATVYKDGKRWCFASSDGSGGPTDFYALNEGNPSKLRDEIAEFEKENDSLELVANNLVVEWLDKKDLKKILKKTAAYSPKDNKIYTFKNKYSDNIGKQITSKFKDYILLNTLSFDEAFKLFKKAMA